jgi:L-lactate dehydrogenase complex protein LldG
MTRAAREGVLGRVRSALIDVPADEAIRWEHDLPATPALPSTDSAAVAALFVERVEDYHASVTRCARSQIPEVVGNVCERHAARRVALPAGVPFDWLVPVLEGLPDDPPLDVGVLDSVDGVLTGSAIGIAETGTIILDGGRVSGRRVLSLVPDLHICVVREHDLVRTVPEAFQAVADAVVAGRPITLISGPSATSDIELERVEGVHGPRRLEVVLVGEQGG